MTPYEMIVQWLEEHGYDGLYDPYTDCGCMGNDLLACESHFAFCHCRPGYITECEVGGEYDYTIGPNKPSECEYEELG